MKKFFVLAVFAWWFFGVMRGELVHMGPFTNYEDCLKMRAWWWEKIRTSPSECYLGERSNNK